MFLKDLFHSSRLYRGKFLCVGVIALYQILAFSLWKSGDGLPYVMDGNENWSNAGHAKNMVDYGWEGLKKSWGLADEVPEMSGKHPEAHPVIYSHGGEFPRIWITFLYLLGFVSVSQQILITAMIIGGLAVFFAYRVFEYVLDSHVWAAVACGFMVTDYIGIMQWMVNTWRVWQIFSFYGSMYYVVVLLRQASNWRVQLLGGFMAFSLFYAEPVFAMFTGLSVAIFFLISKKVLSWRNLSSLAQLKGFTLGAVMAALLLATQLVGYYGASNFVKDIKFTIVSRNFADEREAEQIKIKNIEFYSKNNVMFMPNYETGKYNRRIGDVINNSFGVSLIHVPLLCLAVAVFGAATFGMCQIFKSSNKCQEVWRSWELDSLSSAKTIILFSSMWSLYISIFYKYGDIINWADGETFVRSGGRGLPGLILGSIALGFYSSKIKQGEDKKRLCAGLVLGMLVSLAVQVTKPADMTYFRSLSERSNICQFAYFIGSLLMPFWVLSRNIWSRQAEFKFSYILGSVFIATILMTPIFAGYLNSGYISRCCPLVAFGIFPILAMTVRSIGEPLLNLKWLSSRFVWRGISGCIVVAWLGSALAFCKYLPPHGAESIQWIARNIAGQVIVTQNYAMPYAYEINGLARSCDPRNIIRKNESPRPVEIDRTKTWFRETHMISGFENPAVLVDYKQNHSLSGWGGNLKKITQKEREARLMDNRGKEPESLIFREIKPNNHFEVYKLSWNPIPYIKLSDSDPKEFFRAEYPTQHGGYARHLNPTELKDLNYQKTEMGSGATVEAVTLGLRIIDQKNQPIQLGLIPVLIKNNGDLMLSAAATYADELSEKGDTEIMLYRVNVATKPESTKIQSYSKIQIAEGRIIDYSELGILSKASNSIGIKLSSLEYATDYVIGLQPVAKDGRKGLVYLSRSFRFTSPPNAGGG